MSPDLLFFPTSLNVVFLEGVARTEGPARNAWETGTSHLIKQEYADEGLSMGLMLERSAFLIP